MQSAATRSLLRAQLVPTADGQLLRVGGRIDEHAHLGHLAPEIVGPLVIDLEEVEFINSMGLREWMALLRTLNGRGVPLTLRRCPEIMVFHMNMVASARAGRIESFYAPFRCDACEHEAPICIAVADHAAALQRGHLDPFPCPRCRGDMNFDGLPEHDLRFLRRE